MLRKTSQFKFLRCLVLCLGVLSSPTSVMAQVMTLDTSAFNDASDADGIEQSEPNVSADGPTQLEALTFQYVSDETPVEGVTLEAGDRSDTVIADAKKAKKGKKGKKAKKGKKGKRGKRGCQVFFQGPITKGSEFKAVGDFSSATLIKIFDEEADFKAGKAALQTVKYSSNTAVGSQLGSVVVKKSVTRELTFQYLGTVDDDNQSYIFVSDAKGGKGCKRGKKGKKGKKYQGGNVSIEQTTTETVSESSSDTLIQVFENESRFAFADVRQSYWASSFIYRLAAIDVIQGFPGSDFRPDASLTQAQFSAIISKAFNRTSVRETIAIRNVSQSYWAYSSIQKAYRMGFIDLPGSTLSPEQSLTKLDVLVAIAKGLNYTQVSSSQEIETILSTFTDANTIPTQYRGYIAALVQKGILVNYPNAKTLNLTRVISRSETCALVHQALASVGQVERIDSDYTVSTLQ